jgi:DNA repair photolyase
MGQRIPKTVHRGRGAAINPPNRFESVVKTPDLEQLVDEEDFIAPAPQTQFFADQTKAILSHNDSPDIGFDHSINPYRGCEHGCSYCYARPTHEYLGMNAGIDFESRIMVKHDAAKLFRAALCKPSWKGELIVMSGVTDCYQPIERKLKITRSLLEVALEARQAIGIITKNALVARDVDLLAELASRRLANVNISITSLDGDLIGKLEPRTSRPEARLRAIETLARQGVPVRVMVAPIIPGLNDHEAPRILEAAQQAGAKGAGTVLLRLPYAVAPMFMEWLEAHRPLAKAKVEALIRDSRDGKLNKSEFGQRMRGTGAYAESFKATFKAFCQKLGLNRESMELDTTQFRPPKGPSGQGWLF